MVFLKKKILPQKKKIFFTFFLCNFSVRTLQCIQKKIFFFAHKKLKKPPSKVAHNRPKPFISQSSPAHSPQSIKYCNDNGLVINSAKTKLLLSSKDNFEMFVGDSIVHADPEISLLGIDYNTNFSTSPYLQKLATAAKSRAGMIYRLSFGVPSNLLRLLANGLVIGKILAAAPAAIPFKIAYDDRAANLATENINRSIKSVARTITKTALSDKVSSKLVLEKAGLRTLNEMVASQTALMVWKSNKARDPLGRNLFPERSIMRPTRSINCVKATQPVPGNNTLAANLMARAWNSSSELQTATTIGAARSVARKWAQNLLLGT